MKYESEDFETITEEGIPWLLQKYYKKLRGSEKKKFIENLKKKDKQLFGGD